MTLGPRIVDVAGSSREMGRAHGEDCRSLIADGLARWFAVIEAQTGISGQAYVAAFLGATDFVTSIDRLTPRVLDEVKGIAEGAQQTLGVILAYQMMDEEWAYRVSVMRARRASIEACSAIGVVRENGSALVAQNMDLPAHYDGTQVLLRLRPTDDAELLLFTPAGLIGTTGLNQHGVAVCCNALFRLRHRATGLPVGFVIRGALARKTRADAAAFVHNAPHATGQNYVIGGQGAIVDLEAAPGQVREVPPEGALILHTNHTLANGDLDPEIGEERGSTTVERLEKLRADLAPVGSGLSVDDVKRTLSDLDVPVCVSRGSDWMTLGSLVMELGASPVLHIAPGPPADTAYAEVRFT